MPELPEVETIRRKLNEILPGKTIVAVKQLHAKTVIGDLDQLVGHRVESLERKSKVLNIKLSQGLNILIHLKMTGQLIYVSGQQRLGGGHPTADWLNELPHKHTRVMLEFDDGSKLYFNDQRLFGWWKIVNDQAVEKVFSQLAPDVIDSHLSVDDLIAAFSRRSQAIKQVIMDTTIMSGLGNIYACDALNVARIHPLRPAKSLNREEVAVLLAASRQVLNRGIELGGTTFSHYRNAEGLAGNYQAEVRVYDREGQACYNCGALIEKSKVGGRGTYFCPRCQK